MGRKILEFIKSFFAIILIIISFAFLNAYMALQSTSKLISKENLTNVIKETDFEDLVDQVDREELYEELEDDGISKETIDSVLENEKFQETIASIMSEGLTALVEGNKMSESDKEKFSENLIEVADKAISDGNIKLTAKEKEDVHQQIEQGISELINSINESGIENAIAGENISDENMVSLRDGIKVIRVIYQNKIWFLVVAIIMLVLAGLLKLKDFKFLKWIGGTMIFYGVSFLSFGRSILVAWSELLTDQAERYKSILETSINAMSRTYYIGGFIFLILGIILVIAKPVYLKYKNNESSDKSEIETIN